MLRKNRGHSNPDFFLHEKTGNNLLGINSSTWRIVYRIRDQRVRSEGKTSALVERRTEREISSSSGPRRRRRFQLMPEIERTCFDIRLLIDPLSLFFHFFPSSSLLVYIIPRNTLLFSFSSNAWPPSTIYFTSTLEKFCEKNMEKCWIPNGKIEEKRKIV